MQIATVKPKALLSWSSGKDSAWALHVLRSQNEFEIVGLVTTFNEAFNRVAMHGVRMELVHLQAKETGIPLWSVPLPWPCSNEIYEKRMREVVQKAVAKEINWIAFGDLHLQEIRDYREKQLAGTGLEPIFPIWGTVHGTVGLAHLMIDGGLRATLACVDPKQLGAEFVGRDFDRQLLNELPGGVDPCGERGEFHTFCHAGPMFNRPIAVEVGARVERDGFWYADLTPRNPTP